MTTSNGKHIDPNSKSEKIMRLYLAGISPKKIAEIMCMNRSTVRQLIWKRRRKTRRMVADGTST